MDENTNKKVVAFDDFAEAAKLIATKAEVKAVEDQVKNIGTGGVTYATTEEVLALFQETAAEGGGSGE